MEKHKYVIKVLECMDDASKELNFQQFQYFLNRVNEITNSMLRVAKEKEEY